MKYTNILLLKMYRQSITSFVLRESEPLPVITIEGEPEPLRAIDLAHVLNRLKVMADIDPVRHKQPVDGRFMLDIRGVPVDVYVHFDDRCADPCCEITMEVGTSLPSDGPDAAKSSEGGGRETE
ncbi:MAG: hypothetical protein ACYTFI_04990 [Planctomycetota bacterium]